MICRCVVTYPNVTLVGGADTLLWIDTQRSFRLIEGHRANCGGFVTAANMARVPTSVTNGTYETEKKGNYSRQINSFQMAA